MHRSGSTSRASELMNQVRSGMEMDQLPMYDPQSEISKKEASRLKLAENMVHLIPLVLILCALLLWFFSHAELDMTSKDDSIIERIKNMTIEGYTYWNGSSTVGVEELDPVDGNNMEDTGRNLGNENPA